MTSVRHILLIALLSAASLIVTAQPQPPDPQQDPDAVPFTGLEYLLVGGGIYGVSRFLKNRKRKSDEM